MKKIFSKRSTVVSAICVIAILATLICQFIPCWNFSGVVTEKGTSEQYASDMDSSIASYIWFPASDTSAAFIDFLKDPTLSYSDITANTTFTAEELAECEELAEIQSTFSTSKATAAETTEDAVTEETAAEEATAEEAATEEATTEETATEETATETAQPEEEAEENASTDATAEDAEPAESEEAAEEAPAAAPAEDEDCEYTYAVTLTEIKEYHIDATDASTNTVLAKKADPAKALEEYTDYAKIITTDYTSFINGLVILPILVLLGSILGIILILLSLRKGLSDYIAPIFTLVVGVLNLIVLLTQPIFILAQAGVFTAMACVSGVTAIVGLVVLCLNIVSTVKHKVAAKKAVKF